MLMTIIGLAVACIGFALLLVAMAIDHVDKLSKLNELTPPDLTNITHYTGSTYNRHGREIEP